MLKEEAREKVSHVVTRPGRKHGDADVQIPVAEALATVRASVPAAAST